MDIKWTLHCDNGHGGHSHQHYFWIGAFLCKVDSLLSGMEPGEYTISRATSDEIDRHKDSKGFSFSFPIIIHRFGTLITIAVGLSLFLGFYKIFSLLF